MQLKCTQCGIKYRIERNVKRKHFDFCSRKCVEDWLDVQAQVTGAREGTGEDNPASSLFDWNAGIPYVME